MPRTADYSDFLAKPAYGSKGGSRKQTDHVTKHLETMFRMNVITRVGLPAVLCVGMITQVHAGLMGQIETSLNGAFGSVYASLEAAGEDMPVRKAEATQQDLTRLLGQLKAKG